MLGPLMTSGWSLLAKTKWFREAGLDTTTVKRLILVECRKNLALLEPLKLGDNDVAQDAPVLIAVARRIEFASIEMLLADDDKASKTLSQLRELEFPHESEEQRTADHGTEDGVSQPVSLAERIIRLYIRMYSLRTLADIWSESGEYSAMGVKQIRFRTRLNNLRETLLAIERVLTDRKT